MKKTFVKYFGVASATLLAAAPAVTPALLTASNLQTVKADAVQDSINNAFRADNSIVSISNNDWDQLTKINPDEVEEPAQPEISADYLATLHYQAQSAKQATIRNISNKMSALFRDMAEYDRANSGKTKTKKYVLAEFITGTKSADDVVENLDGSSLSPTFSSTVNSPKYTVAVGGNGKDIGSIKSDTILRLSDWVNEWTDSDNIDNEAGEVTFLGKKIFGDREFKSGDYSLANTIMSQYFNGLPDWWFVSATNTIGSFTANSVEDSTPSELGSGKLNIGSKIFEPRYADVLPEAKGYITVVPDGGTRRVSGPNDPSLKFAGDNIAYLQKLTGDELFNLLPSSAKNYTQPGKEYSVVPGIVKIKGNSYRAKSAKEGSTVWDVILKSMFNSNFNGKTLAEITSKNNTTVKMLVNGKDATKSEFVDVNKDIKNAEKFSVQLVFNVGGVEYKSPTIWLSHGQRYSVNTSDLANISRRPGDFYGPNFNITGTDNDTGAALDQKRFVVVPAGTNLESYAFQTDQGKIKVYNISDLASLITGIQDTATVDFGNHDTVAEAPFDHPVTDTIGAEGGHYSVFWPMTNRYYSKYGTYNDAVDIYYIDGEGIGVSNLASQSKYSARRKAAEAVELAMSKYISDEANYTGSDNKLETNAIIEEIFKAARPYFDSSRISNAGEMGTKNGSTLEKNMYDIFIPGTGSNEVFNKDFVSNVNSYPGNQALTAIVTGTLPQVAKKIIMDLSIDCYQNTSPDANDKDYEVKASDIHKVASNVGRTTKVDVPSKYLPQVSFTQYNTSASTFYDNGSVIQNWYKYDKESGSNESKGAYYPNGGVTVTSGSSSSSSESDAPYYGKGSFKVGMSADELNSKITTKIQSTMSAKLSNPNTEADSKKDGYYKGYTHNGIKADAVNAYIANGHIPAEDLKVDTSTVDVTKPGNYYVTVTYTPLNSIKKNANGEQTNKFVQITDAKGNLFLDGHPTNDKPFVKYDGSGTATGSDPVAQPTRTSSILSKFDADQIFANGAPSTFKLAVEITDGTSSGVEGSPVIAFTNGGENITIPKGGSFNLYDNLQFYAFPGAKPWDQKDSSLKVEVSGEVNTNVEGKYTLIYKVTNSAGKTSTLTRVVTVGSGVEAPTEYDFNMSPAYINYVPGYYVREFSSPRAEWSGQQVQHATSVNVTKKAVFQDGETWYKLGDGNWVKAEYVVAGNAPSSDGSTPANGVVDINYVPGYGIAVYKAAGTGELVTENGAVKRLPHGTSWKSFKKQTVNGITYYNLGGNQWVDGRYVNFH